MTDRDAWVEAAAESCLDRNLSLPRGRVSVYVRDGWITISGRLDWQFQRDAAEYGLLDIPGAIGLTNCITIKAQNQPMRGFGAGRVDGVMRR